MITRGYYWEKGKAPEAFTDEDVRVLIDRAQSQERFDGERSEIYASQLVWALVILGDERFAGILQDYPGTTRTNVGWFIDGVWSHHKLSYPVTQAAIKTTKGE